MERRFCAVAGWLPLPAWVLLGRRLLFCFALGAIITNGVPPFKPRTVLTYLLSTVQYIIEVHYLVSCPFMSLINYTRILYSYIRVLYAPEPIFAYLRRQGSVPARIGVLHSVLCTVY